MIYNEIINLEKRRMASVTQTLCALVALREQQIGRDTHVTKQNKEKSENNVLPLSRFSLFFANTGGTNTAP